jgi:ABC-type transport system involved in Fe-S cluster assembly fused permease/ATPase subunit
MTFSRSPQVSITILISHRFSAVLMADTIAVLSDGKLSSTARIRN